MGKSRMRLKNPMCTADAVTKSVETAMLDHRASQQTNDATCRAELQCVCSQAILTRCRHQQWNRQSSLARRMWLKSYARLMPL